MEKDLGKGGENSFQRHVSSSYTEKTAHRGGKKKRHLKTELQKICPTQFICNSDD